MVVNTWKRSSKVVKVVTTSTRGSDSLMPRPHPLRKGRSGAPSPNSWIVPQNEERPIRSLKDYVITFLSILYRLGRGSGNDIHSD